MLVALAAKLNSTICGNNLYLRTNSLLLKNRRYKINTFVCGGLGGLFVWMVNGKISEYDMLHLLLHPVAGLLGASFHDVMLLGLGMTSSGFFGSWDASQA